MEAKAAKNFVRERLTPRAPNTGRIAGAKEALGGSDDVGRRRIFCRAHRAVTRTPFFGLKIG